jgi:hypothetical protein
VYANGRVDGERGKGRDMTVAVAAIASRERGKSGVGGGRARTLMESLAVMLPWLY